MKDFLPEGYLINTPQNKFALHSPLSIADCCAKGTIVEAKAIICDSSHNIIVDLVCMKGVIPREHGAIGIADGSVRDIALISRVGKPVSFVIMGVEQGDDGKPIAILSRTKAQEMCLKEYIGELCTGDVIPAKVTHLEPFGAFCDIGCGIASLLPIDAISVSRISHPSDRFNVGDDIKVVVKSVEDNRITLSQKELLGTWEENAQMFSQGETVFGIVRSVESYGVFVELTPNLAGLAEPKEDIKPGDIVSVFIKNIIPEKMKIKLIVIDKIETEYTKEETKYFCDKKYIDKFVYSPVCSQKTIETQFC